MLAGSYQNVKWSTKRQISQYTGTKDVDKSAKWPWSHFAAHEEYFHATFEQNILKQDIYQRIINKLLSKLVDV